jgi:hypothetical protein
MKRYVFPLTMAAIVAVAIIAVLGFDVSYANAGALTGFSVCSIEAPNWYTKQYDTRVHHLLQSEGFLLRNTTSAPVEVKGNTLVWFFMGRGEAQPFGKTPELAKSANLGKSTLEKDMSDWQFFDMVRHLEPEKISVEYRGKIQEAGAMSLGRKFDRIIMEAMDGEAGNIATIGNGTAAISPIQLSTGKAQINAVGMMKQNEFFLPVPSMSWEQLGLYKQFNNREYTGEDLQWKTMADAKTWNKIHIFQAPDEMFTAFDAHSVDTYLWNKATVGFGQNAPMSSKITYENMYTAWAYNTVMSGACRTLQNAGVKRLRIKIDDPLTIN